MPFYVGFIPWGVCEESQLRFESLRQGTTIVSKYEIYFSQLAHHATIIILTKEERIDLSHQTVDIFDG